MNFRSITRSQDIMYIYIFIYLFMFNFEITVLRTKSKKKIDYSFAKILNRNSSRR